MFFSEEKNQKTFISAPVRRFQAMAGILSRVPETKVFCVFSSEKKDFFNNLELPSFAIVRSPGGTSQRQSDQA
jgi:hypothetical protein